MPELARTVDTTGMHTHTYMVCPCFSINPYNHECPRVRPRCWVETDRWRLEIALKHFLALIPSHPQGLPWRCYHRVWKGVLSWQSMIQWSDLRSIPTPAVSGMHWWHLTPWHRHWWANCSSPGTRNSLWLRSSQMICWLKWIRDSVIHPMFSFTLNHMYIMPYSQESFCFVSTCGQETTSAWTPLVNNFSRIVSASNAIPLFPHTFLKPQGAKSIWWHSNGHEFWVPSLLLTREEPQSYCSHRYPRKLRMSVFPFKHYEPPHSHHLLYRVYSNLYKFTSKTIICSSMFIPFSTSRAICCPKIRTKL